MCCILFSDKPVEGLRYTNINAFEVPLSKAPCASSDSLCWCLLQCFPLTAPCAQIALRRKVLGGNMKEYSCCQGYFTCCGAANSQLRRKTSCELRCPSILLCLEATFCNCFAVSASRLLVMDKHDLRPDPMDNQIIRCQNCIAAASCICNVLAICCSDLENCACCLNVCAQIGYCLVSGCMTAQTVVEVDYQQKSCLARHVSSISEAFVLTDKEKAGYSEFIEAGKGSQMQHSQHSLQQEQQEQKEHKQEEEEEAKDVGLGHNRSRSHRRQQPHFLAEGSSPPVPGTLSSPIL